jgi:hypothetical protein
VARLFDAYVAVDWSARSLPSPARPSPDAVWVGETVVDGVRAAAQEWYWRTRYACREFLEERIAHHVDAGRRVFVGFDFALGFPAGFARALGLAGNLPPWRLVWREIERLIVDRDDNRNNRFEVAAGLNRRCGGHTPGPFWGCPPARRSACLESTSPSCGYPFPLHEGEFLDRWRWVDRREPRIQPVWKLFGNGSVGSQTLMGIPVVAYLRFRTRFSDVGKVWPFETGFTPEPVPRHSPRPPRTTARTVLAAEPFVLYGEIWPTITPRTHDGPAAVKDQAQVRTVAAWLARADEAGRLSAFYDRPDDLPGEALAAAVAEEGWIVGAGL